LGKIILFEKESNIVNYKSRTPTNGPELELTNKFLSSVKENYSNKNNDLAIFVEPKIQSLYPDIVMVEYSPNLIHSWTEKRRNLASKELMLLSILSKQKLITFENLVNSTYLNSKEIVQSIEKLLDSNMIQRKQGNWSLKNKRNIFAIKKISAIEAKIDNWQTALKQATLNIGYANESFILSNIKNPQSKTIKLVDKYGIGIYNMDNDSANIVAKPKKYPMANNQTVWQLNEWIGQKLSEGQYCAS
jgi:predicted transcriptional regulator